MPLANKAGYGRRMKRTGTASIVIPASHEQVYAALLDPSALETWLPPDGMTGRILEFDPHPGGTFRMELTYLDGGEGKSSLNSDITEVTFIELVPATRILQQVVFESDDPLFAGVMTMTWSLGAAVGSAAVEIRAEDVPPAVSPEDHARGLAASLRNLASHLAGRIPED